MKFLMIVDLENRHPWPSDKNMKDVIFENNTTFTVISPYDPVPTRIPRIAVECENKPRDMPVFGISWKEIL